MDRALEAEEKDLFYIPVDLPRARDRIVAEHELDPFTDDLSKNSWLEVMVRHIATVDGGRYQRFMNKLAERDITLLAQYLPHNYFKTEIGEEGYERVAAAVQSRSSVKVMQDLLMEWQMEYQRPECNQVLKVYAHTDANMHEVLEKHHFGGLFLYLLDQPDIPTSLARILLRDHRIPGRTFEEKYTGLGLNDALPLYHECEKRAHKLKMKSKDH